MGARDLKFKLYFEEQDEQNKWYKFLQNSCGSHKVTEHYKFKSEHRDISKLFQSGEDKVVVMAQHKSSLILSAIKIFRKRPAESEVKDRNVIDDDPLDLVYQTY